MIKPLPCPQFQGQFSSPILPSEVPSHIIKLNSSDEKTPHMLTPISTDQVHRISEKQIGLISDMAYESTSPKWISKL